ADMDGDGKPDTAAAVMSSGSALAVAPLDGQGKLGAAVTMPLKGAGPKAWLFPWKTADNQRPVAILPLSSTPIQFIPYNGGKWLKDGGAPVTTTLEPGAVIRSAAVLQSPGGKERLALLIASKTTSKLAVFTQANGRFTPEGEAQTLG